MRVPRPSTHDRTVHGTSINANGGSSPLAYFDIDNAALRLSTTPIALRARCRRHARREGREVVARLGAGVVAYKFGASWRVRFPD